MKKFKLLFIGVVLLTFSASISTSCDKLGCNGKGTLEVTNSSLSTVQKLMINGVNYGSLDPGEKKSVDLTPGPYVWQLVGISGGTGCSAAEVNITECQTSTFKCSGK
jgi:hypothetical protein